MQIREIDVRGYSCPQPLLEADDSMKKMKEGSFRILFDCVSARENISRAAGKAGWTVTEVTEHGEYTSMLLTK